MNTTVWDYIYSPTCWLVFLGAFGCTFMLTPAVMLFAHKTGAVREGGYRRVHNRNTPLLGGLAIALPVLFMTLLATQPVSGMFRAAGPKVHIFYLIAGGAAAMALLGMLDDMFQMRARYKLMAQLAIATAVAVMGGAVGSIEIPLFGVVDMREWHLLGVAVAVIWLVGVTNAVNFIDGMDGLAAGVALIMAAALGGIAALNGKTPIVIPCIALVGSLAAFLYFNWHPAKIFLGDTGSMFLGFTLAAIALLGAQKSTGGTLITATLLAMGVPIFETFISVVRRHVGGFSIFAADAGHTHHRLLRKGFSQRQVALIMYAAALVCLGAGVLDAMPDAGALRSRTSIAVAGAPFVALLFIAGYTRSILRIARKRMDTKRKMTFAEYMGMRLKQDRVPINHNGKNFLALICEEFNLDALALCIQGETSAGVIYQRNKQPTSARMRHFTMHVNNCHPIRVRYAYNSTPDEGREQTIEACLSSIFDNISSHNLGDTETPQPTCNQHILFCDACEQRPQCSGFKDSEA